MKRLLCLSAHPDDCHLNAGGTIARFVEEGWEVWDAVFCAAENVGDMTLPKSVMYAEFKNASRGLGIQRNLTFDFPHRRLNETRQDILDVMVQLGRDVQPDLVIIPSLYDTHQDHEVIAKEGMRAFKKTNLWGFEAIWNNLNFDSKTFVRLQASHIESKILALSAYESWAFKEYLSPEFIWNLAKVRGVQIGVPLAECFSGIREII